jgi:hypothetical protein
MLRRHCSYSLPTLFALVTLVGCWLGYQLNWIRARHNALKEYQAHQLSFCGMNIPDAPFPLGWFGETNLEFIQLGHKVDAATEARLRSLFPESALVPPFEILSETDDLGIASP